MDVTIIEAPPTITAMKLLFLLAFHAISLPSIASLHQLVATKARPNVIRALLKQKMPFKRPMKKTLREDSTILEKSQKCPFYRIFQTKIETGLRCPTEPFPTAASSYLSSMFFDCLIFLSHII